MSEKEIRGLLRTICDRLDERARRVTRKVVVPTMLGASLALSGCGDGRSVASDAKVVAEAGPLYGVPAPDAIYAAPWDGGAIPPYMGPDAGPQPEYIAPDDAGVVPPYMGPDAGPQPDYLAPDLGPVPLYLGPPTDAK